MKENKTQVIKTRITDAEEQEIIKYCKEQNLSRSNFVRIAIQHYLKEVNPNGNS